MTSKEWAAVAIVIGGGILLQIPGHEAMEMDHSGMQHAPMSEGADGVTPGLERVVLDVTGMT